MRRSWVEKLPHDYDFKEKEKEKLCLTGRKERQMCVHALFSCTSTRKVDESIKNLFSGMKVALISK
jgi:hypothetical protein